MKTRLLLHWGLSASLLLGLGAAAGRAAPAPKAPPAAAPAFPAAPPEVTLPRSVFEVPKSPQDGRDPFFPNSPRPFGTTSVTKTNAATGLVNLSLKALAGAPGKRFATINNVDFTEGEEREVVAGGTRVRVRCLEIKEDAVLIEVNGVRRTLRMRAGF